MEIQEKKLLAKYTTFHMGGMAQKLYFPETVEDLKLIESMDKDAFHYVLGGGSNLLVNDEREFPGIISTRKLNHVIQSQKEGKYYVGTSVTLQELIRSINEQGYGGIEYLYSVPGTVGGAICMNAGRGRVFKKSISDHIVWVDFFRNGKVKTLHREECSFQYRMSVFQEMKDTIILGALFEFPGINIDEAHKNIQERLELCRRTQDTSAPNMGSVFSTCDADIMNGVKRLPQGEGVVFSDRTMNWLLNRRGTFAEAIHQIERVQLLHQQQGKECSLEVKIWS